VRCCCAARVSTSPLAQVDEVFGGLTEADGEARIAGFLELAHPTAYRERGIAAADALTAHACATLFETDDLAHGIESLLSQGPRNATFHGR